MMTVKATSKQTLQRLPTYLNYLKMLVKDERFVNVSATNISESLNLNHVQVRKDLATVSSGGKPKVGYKIKDLIHDIEEFLGYNDVDNVVLVGVGKLGEALLEYNGFKEYGLNIVAGFDSDVDKLGERKDGRHTFHVDKLGDLCSRMQVNIGIVAVPAEYAQSVCDMLVESGVKAIWNFAPVHLVAPNGIIIRNENIASSLAMLAKELSRSGESQP